MERKVSDAHELSKLTRDLSHLYLCKRKHSAEADPCTVHERKDMMIALNLFCFGRQTLPVVDPPFRLELLGIWSPYFCRAIYSLDRNNDGCSFFHAYRIDSLARCRGNRSRERYIVILGCLCTIL